ncbi:MAG: hypothetical protein AAB410_02770 [Patescibacteria group bacterium]
MIVLPLQLIPRQLCCEEPLFKVEGMKIFAIFFFWSIFGPLLEALVGKTYLGIRGRHLWLYEKFPLLNRTTSWLSVPFWAFAGSGIWAMNIVLENFLKNL